MSRTHKNAFGGMPWRLGVSLIALSTAFAAPAFAQDAGAADVDETNTLDTVVVTGIRGSLKEAMDFKRDADGVLDAINAEDIGKFPNTNLAEALQRIPGVSIDRVNGEGAQITVRGFGPGFNQVTLNGRSMPTADVPIVGAGLSGDNSDATTRAFDFSNLASDGVRALEVYKTGRADIASGGIGATVNIVTRKPLDEPGFQASLSGKAVADTSVDRGDEITPEIAGTLNWSDESGKFGIGLFGSYSDRQSAAASAFSSSWEVIPYSTFTQYTNAATNITNAPTDPNTLISTPRDSRYVFSEFERERLNGQVVLQFAPTDRLRMTTDYTFAVNEGKETGSELSNWFGRGGFSDVVFDDSVVPTTTFIKELVTSQGSGNVQKLRQTKDELKSFGFNAEFDLRDDIKIVLDAHSSTAEVSPNGPLGFTELQVGLDHRYQNPFSHAVDYSGDIPVMTIETATGDVVIDPTTAGSQIANDLLKVTQKNEIDQIDLRAEWELDDRSNLVVGANYRSQSNTSEEGKYNQVLGNWGANNPGDAASVANLEVFCVSCRFEDHTIGGTAPVGGTASPNVYGIRGDAGEIFLGLSPLYAAAAGYDGIAGNNDDAQTLNLTSSAIDTIEEDVTAIYAQFTTEFEIADKDAYLNVGLRYENTDVTSTTNSAATSGILWFGNNDFTLQGAAAGTGQVATSSYDNFMPNVDFAIDVTGDMKARASYSRTIARAAYDNLFASNSVNKPNGPTALAGGILPTGSKGAPGLLPLESDNFDVSWEWYYGDSSYVSLGAFEKRVRNFVGTSSVQENLFGLLDPSSGAAGTRSGNALAIIDGLGAARSQDNLYAATAYIVQAGGDLAAAQATFVANQDAAGNIPTGTVDALEAVFPGISADANDPFYIFNLSVPVNNREAKINGIEIQGQHFFGDTGFGVSGSYTMVDADVGFDLLGSPTTAQFALIGLSDTANITAIYEKYGFSGRLSYNWRDAFLSDENDGNNNPIFTDAYAQVDLSLGYEVNEHLSLSFEGINLNEERSRTYQRSEQAMRFLRENGARYYLGARYKF